MSNDESVTDSISHINELPLEILHKICRYVADAPESKRRCSSKKGVENYWNFVSVCKHWLRAALAGSWFFPLSVIKTWEGNSECDILFYDQMGMLMKSEIFSPLTAKTTSPLVLRAQCLSSAQRILSEFRNVGYPKVEARRNLLALRTTIFGFSCDHCYEHQVRLTDDSAKFVPVYIETRCKLILCLNCATREWLEIKVLRLKNLLNGILPPFVPDRINGSQFKRHKY